MRAYIPIVLVALQGAAFAQIQILPAVNYPAATTPDGLASGDFNGDGKQDFAVAALSPDRVLVYRNNGNGTFAAPTTVTLPAGSAPIFVRAVDADGDGDIDLVVVLRDSKKIQFLINNGTGSFTLGATVNTGNNPRWLITRPLRAGTAMDMAVLNRADGTMTVYLNAGNFNFYVNTYPVGSDPRSIAPVNDLTPDALPDLCITSYAEHKVSIYNNDGNGHFTATGPLALEPGLSPNGIVGADLSGDGKSDVAIASTDASGNGVVSVYKRISGIAFEGPTTIPTGGLGAGQIAAADMDHDGKLDLVVVNPNSGNLSILRRTGPQQFASAMLVSVGTQPRVMTIADLGGDTLPDIAVSNLGSNNVSVLISGQGSTSCYANCDASTAAPVLNVNDFQCFVNKFAAGNSYANCDNSTAAPILNVNDFQCFVNKFAAGCT